MAFTSDLSIDEVLLIEEVGFEPLRFVMGASYFNIGYAPARWGQNMELDQLTQMMMLARHQAMRAVYHELSQLQADGVVGVRLEVEREGHNAEFVVMGTAVRRRDGQGARWRDARGWPFTCDLSGQDFWALVRGGFRPVGLVMGACVYHIAHMGLGQWLKQTGVNTEQAQFTQGIYDARELAMERMQAESVAAGGEGIVGVRVEEGSYGWASHVQEFFAIGTAVAAIGDPAHEVHEPPTAVLGVDV
jgi:uncharacterized protein YbjQ (UPF0145 family)